MKLKPLSGSTVDEYARALASKRVTTVCGETYIRVRTTRWENYSQILAEMGNPGELPVGAAGTGFTILHTFFSCIITLGICPIIAIVGACIQYKAESKSLG